MSLYVLCLIVRYMHIHANMNLQAFHICLYLPVLRERNAHFLVLWNQIQAHMHWYGSMYLPVFACMWSVFACMWSWSRSLRICHGSRAGQSIHRQVAVFIWTRSARPDSAVTGGNRCYSVMPCWSALTLLVANGLRCQLYEVVNAPSSNRATIMMSNITIQSNQCLLLRKQWIELGDLPS